MRLRDLEPGAEYRAGRGYGIRRIRYDGAEGPRGHGLPRRALVTKLHHETGEPKYTDRVQASDIVEPWADYAARVEAARSNREALRQTSREAVEAVNLALAAVGLPHLAQVSDDGDVRLPFAIPTDTAYALARALWDSR